MTPPATVEAPTPEAPDRPTGRNSPWAYVGVAVVLAFALMWVWIFSGAARKANPDRVADREWAEQAEETCASTMEGIDTRSAPAGRQDAAERADDIDASTAEIDEMLAVLADPLPEGDADHQVVEPWLDDWADLVADRRQYAAAVRVNPDARFLTTEKFRDGLDRVIETFADVNDMPSCGPAGDVG